MFFIPGCVIPFLMMFIDFVPFAKDQQTHAILTNAFYLILGFASASGIIYYNVERKIRVSNKGAD